MGAERRLALLRRDVLGPQPSAGCANSLYLREAAKERDLADEDGDSDVDDGGDTGNGGDTSESDDHGEFSLTITDASGQHVRTLDAPGAAGINEVIWDWRYDRPYEPVAGQGGGGGGRGGGGRRGGGTPQGPIVLPGTYTVSMEVAGQSHSSTVEIIAEPRRPMTRADRMARQDALMSLYTLAAPIYEATQAARRVGEQLDVAEELIEGADEAPESLMEELTAIREELTEVEEELELARDNASVAGAIQGSSTLPTADQLWQVDRAWEVLPAAVERLNEIVLTRMPALNAMLNAEGVRPSVGETIEIPRRRGG